MTKLTQDQKQIINGGFVISPIAIQLIHGLITLSWVGLEVANIVADNIPKKITTRKESQEIPIRFENNLITSKITISS